MASFSAQIAAAVARQQADGITGWGMSNPSEALFEEIVVGEVYGCDSATCNCNSHGSAAATYKYIPKRGTLVELGREGFDSWTQYYVLLDGDEVLAYIEVDGDRAYHDRAAIVDSVPDWCLTNFVKE